MQGGASEGGYTLTAYVLIVLLQNHVQNKYFLNIFKLKKNIILE
jgi:hypothetical protein